MVDMGKRFTLAVTLVEFHIGSSNISLFPVSMSLTV